MSSTNTSFADFLNVWRRWAGLRGFVFVPPGGSWWSPTSVRLEGQQRDVAIEIDTYAVSNGRTSISYTRVRSHAQVALDVEVRVHPGNALDRAGEALGFTHPRTGDADFDARFIVHASPESLAGALLDADTRRAMMNLPVKHFSFKYARGESTMSWVGLCRDELTLDAACALAVAAGLWRKDATLYR